jgi:hypothetical protein
VEFLERNFLLSGYRELASFENFVNLEVVDNSFTKGVIPHVEITIFEQFEVIFLKN